MNLEKKKKYIALGSTVTLLAVSAIFYTISNHEKPVEVKDMKNAAGAMMEVKNESTTEKATIEESTEAPGKGDNEEETVSGTGNVEDYNGENIAVPKKKLTKYEKFEAALDGMGLVDLGESRVEALYVHEEMDKESKVTGYIANGGRMKILEGTDGDEWYKIKSGKITGYVRSKYVLTGKDAKKTLFYNKDVIARVGDENLSILANSKRNSASLAIAYKDTEYPIEKFNKNKKYAYIKRTATISGWVPVKDIKIVINAPKAMTKSRFKKYLTEFTEKEKEALEDYLYQSISSTGNSLMDSVIKLISHNESGDFKSARNPRSSGEKTITVGAWQWYGENAHSVLKEICNSNRDKAQDLIEDSFSGRRGREKAEKLLRDILSGSNWVNENRIFSNQELVAIKALLGSDLGISVQNSRIKSDIQAKVSVAIRTYNLSNDSLVAYICDLYWQNPAQAKTVVDGCIEHFGGTRGFARSNRALRYLHRAALDNHLFGRYTDRREYAYTYCRELEN